MTSHPQRPSEAVGEAVDFMNYLRQTRSRVLLISFLLFASLAATFPALDLRISGLFYDGHSFLQNQWWQNLLKDGLGYFLGLSFVAVFVVYVRNRLLKRAQCRVNGRCVAYLLLVGIVGAGLIVNVAFKNNVGRARPRDVVEFGGDKQFTPAFVLSNQCRTNCSFSSGDSAGAFIAIALAMALTRRRRYLAAAVAFGVIVSFSRVSSGAHFFSDTVVSFFVMLICADVFRHYLLLTPAASAAGIQARPALPAFALARAEAAPAKEISA
jgi:lipid A 4'-phosphatase